ncbi:MAG: PilZ domain-containing protein [Candidatus Omnitrophica bacterium]|nr:PilZ domain-containing protein [Candidatus Omnitrophota bacterium]
MAPTTNKKNKTDHPVSKKYSGTERRKWPRLAHELPVKVVRARPPDVTTKSGFSIDPVWTRDLGGAGLGLNAPVHCTIGTELEIEFALPGRDGKIHATLVVVYSKLEAGEKESYRVGVSYKSIKEDERQAIIYYVNDNLP